MSHLCGSTCKGKQSPPIACSTGKLSGGSGKGHGAPRRPHATPKEVGAAVDMYFDGLSYRRTAENVEEYFGRKTHAASNARKGRTLFGIMLYNQTPCLASQSVLLGNCKFREDWFYEV